MASSDAPRMEIRKVGRWTYELSWYADGSWIGFEGPRVWGRRRAERRAKRDLRRLTRLHRPGPLVSVIRSEVTNGR
jgi:hypothetical protein